MEISDKGNRLRGFRYLADGGPEQVRYAEVLAPRSIADTFDDHLRHWRESLGKMPDECGPRWSHQLTLHFRGVNRNTLQKLHGGRCGDGEHSVGAADRSRSDMYW